MSFPIEYFCREQANDPYSGLPLFKCKREELSESVEPTQTVSASVGAVLPEHRTAEVGGVRCLLDDLLPPATYFGEPCALVWRAWKAAWDVDLVGVADAVVGAAGTRFYAARQPAGQDEDRATESVPYRRYAYRLPPTASAEPGDLLRCKARLFLIVTTFEQDGLLVVEADELRRDARATVLYGTGAAYDPIADAALAQEVEIDSLRMARTLRYAVPNTSAEAADPGDATWFFAATQLRTCKTGDVFKVAGEGWRVLSASLQAGAWMAHCRRA